MAAQLKSHTHTHRPHYPIYAVYHWNMVYMFLSRICRQKSSARRVFADYCQVLSTASSAIQLYDLSELYRAFQSAGGRNGARGIRCAGRCQMLRIGDAVPVFAVCAKVRRIGLGGSTVQTSVRR